MSPRVRAVDVIARKRDGGEIAGDELREFVLAYAGTGSAEDWLNNGLHAGGGPGGQHEAAIGRKFAHRVHHRRASGAGTPPTAARASRPTRG